MQQMLHSHFIGHPASIARTRMADYRLGTKIRVYYVKDAFGKKQKIIPCKFNRQFRSKRKHTKAYFDVPHGRDDMIVIAGVDVLDGILDKPAVVIFNKPKK